MIQDIAPHRLLNMYRPKAAPRADSLLFAMQPKTGKVLACVRDGEVSFPEYAALEDQCEGPGALIDLLTLDQQEIFWLRESAGICVPEGYGWYGLNDLRREGNGPRHFFFAAYTAKQLADWYLDNTWCGRCAGRMEHSRKERALVCTACGKTVYPRLNPAIIAGVLDGDRMIVTKYAGRDIPYHALIAGFTEIGETLEETVAREVMEEVGLKVRNIRYYKSQPWAMADDILMGFFCDVDGDTEIHMDASELKEAFWADRDSIVLQPDTFSLTNEMMTIFKEGKL